jgi:hypothetical protein
MPVPPNITYKCDDDQHVKDQHRCRRELNQVLHIYFLGRVCSVTLIRLLRFLCLLLCKNCARGRLAWPFEAGPSSRRIGRTPAVITTRPQGLIWR